MADTDNAIPEIPREPESAPGTGGAPASKAGDRSFLAGRTEGGDAQGRLPKADDTPTNALARPGWFGWQFPFGIGVAAIGAAAARAGIVAEQIVRVQQARGGPVTHERWWLAAGRVALIAPLGAALGFVAIWIIARASRRPLGDWKLAGARMLAAVGLFHLVWRLGALPTDWAWFNAAFAFSLALACYLGALALTFRFRRDELLQLTAVHTGLVVAAHAVIWLAPAIFRPAPKAAPGAPPQSAPEGSMPPTRPAPAASAPEATPPAPEGGAEAPTPAAPEPVSPPPS